MDLGTSDIAPHMLHACGASVHFVRAVYPDTRCASTEQAALWVQSNTTPCWGRSQKSFAHIGRPAHAWPSLCKTLVQPVRQWCLSCAQYVFMDNESYEETRLKKDEGWSRYLKEGTEVALLFWNGKVISVDPPVTVDLEVTDTDPGLKGNTTSGRLPFFACTTSDSQGSISIFSVRHADRTCSRLLLSTGNSGCSTVADASALRAGGSKPATLETGATVNVSALLMHMPKV